MAWAQGAPIDYSEAETHSARFCLGESLENPRDFSRAPSADRQPFTIVAGDHGAYRNYGCCAAPRSDRSGYLGQNEHRQSQNDDSHPASDDGDAGSEQQDDNNGDGDEDDDEAHNQQPCGGPSHMRPFSCPFRKRNRRRFNVRDHPNCNKEFRTYLDVKRHVRTEHLLPAHHRSRTEEQRAARDPEDGIDENMVAKLNEQKQKLKVNTWELLWETLFPNDDVIPSPDYEPWIQAATIEFDDIADVARLRAKEIFPCQFKEKLQSQPLGPDTDTIVSLGTELADDIYGHCLAESRLEFDANTAPQHRKNQQTKQATGGPSNAGNKKKPNDPDRVMGGRVSKSTKATQSRVREPGALQLIAPRPMASNNFTELTEPQPHHHHSLPSTTSASQSTHPLPAAPTPEHSYSGPPEHPPIAITPTWPPQPQPQQQHQHQQAPIVNNPALRQPPQPQPQQSQHQDYANMQYDLYVAGQRNVNYQMPPLSAPPGGNMGGGRGWPGQ
ncbi:hypothetical protein B0J18DRAFT_424952 [Chaetomium sp. MPI-SDFR-AT-0129]|nr:hypothetical protein B0J18DRAFT_424952 [Chaetomium sp. MPI-SDFR-AT-0129]